VQAGKNSGITGQVGFSVQDQGSLVETSGCVGGSGGSGADKLFFNQAASRKNQRKAAQS
jgi:hypothetical protein